MLLLFGLIVLLGSSIAYFVHATLSQELTTEMGECGLLVAQLIVDDAKPALLTQDVNTLQGIIVDHLALSPRLEYIFFVDRTGRVLAHSLGTSFPDDLLTTAFTAPRQEQQIIPRHTSRGMVLHVILPVMDGNAGALHVGLQGKAIQEQAARAVWKIILIMVAVLGVGAVIGSGFLNIIATPINKLSRIAVAIGQGDLEQRIAIGGNDEISQLASAFNTMSMALQETKQNLTNSLHDLMEERDFTREVINSLPGIFYLISQDGRFHLWNKKFEEISGFTSEEMAAASPVDFFRGKERTHIAERVQEVFAQGSAVVEASVVARGGGMATPFHLVGHRIELDGMSYLIGMGLDISERKRMEDALRQAKKTAESAAKAKSLFLANMSHEIRTPLHAVIGTLELLQDPSPSDDQKEQLQLAYYSARTLLFLINDILDYSKIEAGQLQLESVPFDLRVLLREMATAMGTVARTKQISLTGSFQNNRLSTDRQIIVQGDPNRLKQILINLIGNAIKFTPEWGAIHILGQVVARHESDLELMFEVRDTGIGIPEEDRQHIFKRFTQTNGHVAHHFGGTGLGLAICQDLVALMGGRIGVEANAEAATGSRFHFTVRMKKGTQMHTLDSGVNPVLQPLGMQPDAEMLLSSVAILLVDDQPANLTVTKSMLAKLGCRRDRVICVADGQQAVEAFRADRFDLVLMDCQMPVMDGYEASRAMRAWEQTQERPPVPIIAFTADSTAEQCSNSEAAGMNGFLTKPVFLEPLRIMLNTHLM
ncbi:MAG: response regulator [Magnetococcales bacterium]|nr:response regulator [Magnetococcales bacterium]